MQNWKKAIMISSVVMLLSLVYPITSIKGRYHGGIKLIAPLPHKKCLTDKQFNLLIKLKGRVRG